MDQAPAQGVAGGPNGTEAYEFPFSAVQLACRNLPSRRTTSSPANALPLHPGRLRDSKGSGDRHATQKMDEHLAGCGRHNGGQRRPALPRVRDRAH
jgi:hypothetical protein